MRNQLSIITINLNNEIGLRKTIESVVSQTFSDYEYIIIDGGSSDGSIEVIKEFSNNITYWISETDRGIYYAINKGILKASGVWIGIINSGDWYEKDALQKIIIHLKENPNSQIVHGILRVWNENLIYKIQGTHSIFLPEGMIEHPTCFVKKVVYDRIGLYDLNYKISSDYEFMLRAYLNDFKFSFTHEIISNYSAGGISMTSPLASIETIQIKQRYGFAQNLNKRSKLKEVFYTARYLISLLLPNRVRKFLKSFYRLIIWIKDFIFNIDQVINPKKIPIIINNFNRLTFLKQLITSLEKKGYRNIYIIDNASTYQPLLEYYKSCPYKIYNLKKNYGHKALLDSHLNKVFKGRFFVYTDPDLELLEECPDNFMRIFLKTLWKYRDAQKVGFSLKIDDLPDCYQFKQDVINWESKFYKNRFGNVYRADLDTTFALHRPNKQVGYTLNFLTYRTAYPYQVKHLPWYEDSSNISEEEMFYILNKKKDVGTWSRLGNI